MTVKRFKQCFDHSSYANKIKAQKNQNDQALAYHNSSYNINEHTNTLYFFFAIQTCNMTQAFYYSNIIT